MHITTCNMASAYACLHGRKRTDIKRPRLGSNREKKAAVPDFPRRLFFKKKRPGELVYFEPFGAFGGPSTERERNRSRLAASEEDRPD